MIFEIKSVMLFDSRKSFILAVTIVKMKTNIFVFGRYIWLKIAPGYVT